jgi:hypothetical protein
MRQVGWFFKDQISWAHNCSYCNTKIAQYAIFCYKSPGRAICLDREARKQYTLV